MDNPLNPKGGRRIDQSAAVQFGLRQAEFNIRQMLANTEEWMLQSRLAFIYDKLTDAYPLLFPRDNKWNWVQNTLTTPQGAALPGRQ